MKSLSELKHAFNNEIAFFDIADVYGSHANEILNGKAIKYFGSPYTIQSIQQIFTLTRIAPSHMGRSATICEFIEVTTKDKIPAAPSSPLEVTLKPQIGQITTMCDKPIAWREDEASRMIPALTIRRKRLTLWEKLCNRKCIMHLQAQGLKNAKGSHMNAFNIFTEAPRNNGQCNTQSTAELLAIKMQHKLNQVKATKSTSDSECTNQQKQGQ
ncbi:hypothetical protein RJ641_034207 [Dillenia turbinata]|uniref:NADP-dependent oxidoreductase domain-containing protein n=1 Tax=Dillenia turbinata TaxID=194707 RepID=A0AAN8VWR7_9MAGN